MILERIDTTINMSDHFTKGLSRALFHRHADYLLGHIPPVYSLHTHTHTHTHTHIVGTYTNQHVDSDNFVPSSFTTPMTATTAQVYAPLKEDYVGNPWLNILWHG
jgi:hypothetical protein